MPIMFASRFRKIPWKQTQHFRKRIVQNFNNLFQFALKRQLRDSNPKCF